MTVDSISRISGDFYSGDAITAAKSLLFSSVQTKDSMVIRRGGNKIKSDIQNIIQVILEMEPTDPTTFVARNLMDLSPLTLDNTDSLKLLQQIE